MWFLWLAGFVLEDVWGRWLYSAFYLLAGAAALQFHAWLNPGSITPTLGASGAVAALMGAFLVRFPKMKIEMAWIWWFSPIRLLRTGNPFRMFRFKAAAYWLLPLWLGVEILYGTLFGSTSSVAHWAHVGGFVFGALAAVAIRYSGIEQKANKAIEEEVAWTNDAELEQASSMMEHGQLAEAQTLLTSYVAANPNSLDAWALLRQIYKRQSDTKLYLDATVKTCGLHLKAHQIEAAFQDYAEFVDNGGAKMPAMVHVFAAALGISIILANSAAAFATVKYVGAAYLGFLGVRMILDARRDKDGDELIAAKVKSVRNPLWQGVATEVLNPKTALFFLSFIPQFVVRGSGHVFLQFVTLGTVSVALNTTADLIVIALAGPLGERIRASARFRRRQRTVTGAVMPSRQPAGGRRYSQNTRTFTLAPASF